MKKLEITKKHLLVKRARLMKFCSDEGYSNEEIGQIFNIERSWVSRIISASKKYKEGVKTMLSDKKS